ncbi:MAG: hypothetical protein WD009_08820 [Phycisphaeraceae bacterium]
MSPHAREDDERVVAQLARQALDAAEAGGGETRLARMLLERAGEGVVDREAPASGGRAAHAWLRRYLAIECGVRQADAVAAAGAGRRVGAAAKRGNGDIAAELWGALVRLRGTQVGGETEAAARAGAAVDAALARAAAGEPALHAQHVDETLEAWTYTELTALHALHNLALHVDRPDWRRRVAATAAHHQQVTQPDYTTYEPWALAAFLDEPDTRPFAEQQLHDVTTHLRQGTDAMAAAAIGMVLADAVHALRLRPT